MESQLRLAGWNYQFGLCKSHIRQGVYFLGIDVADPENMISVDEPQVRSKVARCMTLVPFCARRRRRARESQRRKENPQCSIRYWLHRCQSSIVLWASSRGQWIERCTRHSHQTRTRRGRITGGVGAQLIQSSPLEIQPFPFGKKERWTLAFVIRR